MEGSKKIEVSITVKSILERMKNMGFHIVEPAMSNLNPYESEGYKENRSRMEEEIAKFAA